MGEIKKITISGFRGVNTPPLELDYKKGDSLQSMMIHGRNGSGKSSIVDAWEWLYSGKVAHLAREGAGPQSYPHKEADEGQTYIKVEFANAEIGEIKLEYDPNRTTRPKIEGDLSNLRKYVPHPCHLRYRDLTEFVYMQKAKKYEFLSNFMGFANALDVQNDMQTCAGRLEQMLKNLEEDRDRYIGEYKEIIGEEPEDAASFIKMINTILAKYDIVAVKELVDVEASIEKLRARVEKDEITQKHLLWKEIQGIVNLFYPLEDIRLSIAEFHTALVVFKRDEEKVSKLILLDLYKKGLEAIESLKIYDKCPLCDLPYKGDLIRHIKSKQGHLDELSKRRNILDAKREGLFLSISELVRKIDVAHSNLETKEIKEPFIDCKEILIKLKPLFEECRNMLGKNIEDVNKEFDFISKVDTEEYKYLLNKEFEIKNLISKRVKILEEDTSRKLLVDNFQRADELHKIFSKWTQVAKKIERFRKITNIFEEIKNDYVGETKNSVQASFDLISSDVVEYFKILEKDCSVIDNPKMKLVSEKDKAVELEIVFGGDPICPAHKILSESQINSFGLSIFLASIKNFNKDFKFIILDDVINSFDAYKRPRVIDLLKEHFPDYQILLLTHDSIWLDRLQRTFPEWIRKHFYGWEYSIGPRVEPGKNSYERIEELVTKDNPVEAGRTFGVYLEWVLQLLCENLEAQVKYNRRNEFTLSELFQAFEQRLKKKLNENHEVVKLILEFSVDTGFRNFCAHWKEPETHYTSEEIKEIVEKWKIIEAKIECDKCHKFIRYEKVDSHEHLSCSCRKLNLKHTNGDSV